MELRTDDFDIYHKALFEYKKRAFENHFYGKKAEKIIDKAFNGFQFADKDKNYILFTSLLDDLNKKLENGFRMDQILAELVNVARSKRKEIDNKELTVQWANEVNEKEKEKLYAELSSFILRSFELNKNVPRDLLVEHERKQVEESKDEYTYFPDKAARGKLIGAINKGFYGDTLHEFKDKNKEVIGPFSTSDRLVKYMSDDLLRFRLAIMELASKYGKRMKRYQRVMDLDFLLTRFYEIGDCASLLYKEYKDLYPEDELKQNITKHNIQRKRIPVNDGVQLEMTGLKK